MDNNHATVMKLDEIAKHFDHQRTLSLIDNDEVVALETANGSKFKGKIQSKSRNFLILVNTDDTSKWNLIFINHITSFTIVGLSTEALLARMNQPLFDLSALKQKCKDFFSSQS